MATTISIDPVTRIEGHLAIRIEVESGTVTKAYSSGEMFRGFEVILKGRHPLDAQQITQRICGVCPVSHGMASVLAQDAAYGVNVPENGRLLRNIIMGANYVQSHILHFYHLAVLDFIDIAAILDYNGNDPALQGVKSWILSQKSSGVLYPAAPFLPRYSGTYIRNAELNMAAVKHYLDALEMRKMAHKVGAVFGGKMPHTSTLVPGGITESVTADKIASVRSMMAKLQRFVTDVYLTDVIATSACVPEYFSIGKGCGNFMAYGVFPESSNGSKKLFPSGVIIQGKPAELDASKITEDVRFSKYSSASGQSPSSGQTTPDPHKNEAYSWIKAPRYQGTVMEVGPLARVLIGYHRGDNPALNKELDRVLAAIGKSAGDLMSTFGRHVARAVECRIVADRCLEWIDQLIPGKPAFEDFQIPETGIGIGLTEAPRGALGHWLKIKEQKIDQYQCVVPTTWNCSPRDDRGIPGAVEQALEGVAVSDPKHPIEAARVVRSFDPCIACAVH